MLPIEERFSAAVHNTARAWRQAIDRRLRHLGIGQASWMAIATIAKNAKPMSQAELAEKLGVEAPTVVATVDRLVKAGYALRQPSETDRRVKLVVLTEQGMAVFHAVKSEAGAFRHELLRGFDKALLAQMSEVLEAIQAAADES